MLLALDSSTMTGSLALVNEKEVLCEVIFKVKDSYSESLLPLIDQVLKSYQVELKEITALAVALGPGSFTALRIGLATVKGLAMSADLPVVGIPSLDAMAWNLPYVNYLLCPVIDARKKEVYTCLYRFDVFREEMERLLPYQVLIPEKIVQHLKEDVLLFGDGVERYGEFFRKSLGPRVHFGPSTSNLPRASNVAALAYKRLERGEKDDISQLAPLYVRRSQGEED